MNYFRHHELTEDVLKTDRQLRNARDLETRLALQRLIEILKYWRLSASRKEVK